MSTEKQDASVQSDQQQGITNDDFGGIFDLTEEDISVDDGYGGERNPDFYGPSLKNKSVKEGYYKSKIRFVPNVNDKNLQIVPKFIYYLPDPDNAERSFYVDCPSNFHGKGSRGNILSTAFFHLKDSESKVIRDMAKDFFSRKRYYWSLIQVIIDTFEEEEEGKIKIFRFGKQVYDMLEREKTDDPKVGKKGIIPHDPFNGKEFVLWIEKKQINENRQIVSYEKSYFDDKLTSISFDKGETRLESNAENKKLIFNFLKKSSPDLSQCMPKEWDRQTEKKVIESVKSIIGDTGVFDVVYKKAYGDSAMYSPPVKEEEKEIAPAESTDSVKPEASKEQPEEKKESLEEKVAEPKAEAKTSTEGGEKKKDGEFDDLDNMNFDEIDK